jgi:tetratricopeptide (TPR) repeat protein
MKTTLVISSFVLAGFLGLPSLDTPHKMNSEGNRYFNNEDYDGARGKYEWVIEKDGSDYRTWYNKGNTLYRQGDFMGAVDSYQEAINRFSPGNPDWRVFYNQGNSFYNLDNPIAAIDSYEKALKLEPNHPDILHNLDLARKKLKEQEKEAGFQFNQPKKDENQEKDKSTEQDSGNESGSEGEDQGERDKEDKAGQKQNKKDMDDGLGMSDRQINDLLKRLEQEERRNQKELGQKQPKKSIFDENDPMKVIEELEKEFHTPIVPPRGHLKEPARPDW